VLHAAVCMKVDESQKEGQGRREGSVGGGMSESVPLMNSRKPSLSDSISMRSDGICKTQ
jgi:hypothetical protein